MAGEGLHGLGRKPGIDPAPNREEPGLLRVIFAAAKPPACRLFLRSLPNWGLLFRAVKLSERRHKRPFQYRLTRRPQDRPPSPQAVPARHGDLSGGATHILSIPAPIAQKYALDAVAVFDELTRCERLAARHGEGKVYLLL